MADYQISRLPNYQMFDLVRLLAVLLAALAVVSCSNVSEQAILNQFFAGIVVENTTEQLTVARVVQSKNESRSFRITPQTKVEGRLAPKARVTVRYVTNDDGDLATLVIVRPEAKGKK